MSSRNMTIPSRPAPPPPQASSASKTNRYSPATNWDDTPFSPQNSATGNMGARVPSKKPPPPRPPPPKVVPALKKPGQPQSINILSNLFGQKRGGAKTPVSNPQKGPIPMKLPPPPKQPPPLGHHNPNYGSLAHHTTPTGNGAELISFDSPPSSPTFTQKSCSDCISVDSFSSDSNYSSPNNGNMSQAESGFEDDFVSQHESQRSKATTPASSIAATPSSSSGLKDLWDLSDPFGMPPSAATATTSHNGHSHYAPVGSATIRAPAVNSKLYEQDFVDPLCNGKSVASRVQTVAMPTIIKGSSAAASSSSQKSTPVHGLVLAPKPKFVAPAAPWTLKAFPPVVVAQATTVSSFDEDPEASLDSLPSLPMPNIPPPPPPVCVDEPEEEEQHREPYGVALYDFNGETDEDLGFRTNDRIYLLKRLNEEWMLGRDRRGCEGMFPANYIEVRVPLAGDSAAPGTSSSNSSSSSSNKHGDISPSATISSFNPPKVQVLYTFNAETADDLTIVENEFVTVLHQITPEWLYGECHGQRGQFPANFIEYVPANLPAAPAT